MRFKIIFFIISPSIFVLLRLIADVVVTYNIILSDSRAQQAQFVLESYKQSVQLEFNKNMLIMNQTRSYITAIQNIRIKTNNTNFQTLDNFQYTHLYYYASTFSSFIKNLPLQLLCENGFIATYNQEIEIGQYNSIQKQCNYIENCELYLQQIDKKTLRFSNNNIQLVALTEINGTQCSIIETHNELFDHLNDTYIMVDNITYHILNQTYYNSDLRPVSNQTDNQYNLTFVNMRVFRPYIRLQASLFFISLSFIILFFTLLFWRYAVKLSYSFVLPLQQFSQISIIKIEQIEISSLQQKQASCSEIKEAAQCLIQSIKTLQIYNKQYGLDAQSLIELSEAKIFFRSINNLAAVGVCCNNIACIHYYHKRYLEALNEQEESIQIGEQEYEGLQQMEKLQSQLSQGSGQMNLLDFYNRFKRTVLRKFFREDTILERINNNQLHQYNNHSQFVGFLTKPRSQTLGVPSEIRSPSIGDISLVDDEEMSNCKIKLANRKYQLLRILIQFSNENNQLFLAEIFSIIKQLIIEIQQIKPQNENLMILQTCLQTKLIFFYSITNQLQKARHLLLRLNLRTNLVKFTIPYLKAVIDIKENRIQEGCFKLIDILNNKNSSLKHYQAALSLLMEVFKINQLNSQLLNNYLLNKIQLQIVLLIDYSSDMTIQQLNLSHTYSKYILSILEEDDLVSLYAYNETIYQVFPFQNNHQFLQSCLTKLLVPLGGQANVLQVLQEVCKRMFTFNKKMMPFEENQVEMKSPCKGDILDSSLLVDQHDQIAREVKNNFEKRYIVLFAEFINDFSEYQLEILRSLMMKRYINLVIIGISNSNKSKKFMQILETITDESIWLRTQKDIQEFFESQKNPEKIQHYNLEIF